MSSAQFPEPASQHRGEKLHQTFKRLICHFKNILNGYTLPEPYFSQDLRTSVDKLFQVLRDPTLPLQELQVIAVRMITWGIKIINLIVRNLQEVMSVIAGRIPEKLEVEIRGLMSAYSGNITSVLCQFPAQEIASRIDEYAAGLDNKQERDMFFMTTQALVHLISR